MPQDSTLVSLKFELPQFRHALLQSKKSTMMEKILPQFRLYSKMWRNKNLAYQMCSTPCFLIFLLPSHTSPMALATERSKRMVRHVSLPTPLSHYSGYIVNTIRQTQGAKNCHLFSTTNPQQKHWKDYDSKHPLGWAPNFSPISGQSCYSMPNARGLGIVIFFPSNSALGQWC